jgi:hypothetical protein
MAGREQGSACGDPRHARNISGAHRARRACASTGCT